MFILKDHQEINNGQEYWNCSNGEYHNNPTVKKLLELYRGIRLHFPSELKDTKLEYGFTRYPISKSGAAFHRDFSRNVNCIVTFFFGETTLYIADNKDGLNSREYQISAGDIIVMRAPRGTSSVEKEKRPVHAIGVVPEVLYTFEIREVYVLPAPS